MLLTPLADTRRALGATRLLFLALGLIAGVEKGGDHLLLWNLRPLQQLEAKLILVGLDRGVDIVDHDADVVHTLKHIYLLVPSTLFLARLV